MALVQEQQAYLDAFIGSKELKPNSARAYELDVRTFFEYLNRGGIALDGLNDLVIADYFSGLDKSKGSTIERKRTVLAGFLRFLAEQGILEREISFPSLDFSRGVGDASLEVVTEEQFARFRETLENDLQRVRYSTDLCDPVKTYLRERNLVFCHLFYLGGLRTSEVAALKKQDVEVNEDQHVLVHIPNEDKSERIVDIHGIVPITESHGLERAVFVGHIRARLYPEPYTEPDAYFLNNSGGRLSGRSIRREISKRSEEEISPNGLRNGHALTLFRSKRSIGNIANRLGIVRGSVIDMGRRFKERGLLE